MDTKIKKRDKSRTKSKILKALGEVIEQSGADKIGVNLIARTAGVNKVLIYRYFGGVEGLMENYVKAGQFTTPFGDAFIENIPTPKSKEQIGRAWREIMKTSLEDLRKRKATRELIRWELSTGKTLLTEVRNESAGNIVDKIGELPNCQDTQALITVLTAGLYYLSAASDFREKMLNVELQTEAGWERINKTISDVIAAFE